MQTFLPLPKYFLCSLTTHAARKMIAYYNKSLEPLGLTAQQMMALGVLWREENISLGVFAERAGIGKAAAVTMIARLEAMGMVVRESNPQDGRLIRLKLTDKARSLAPQVSERVAKLADAIESSIGHEHLKILIKGLTAIKDLDL